MRIALIALGLLSATAVQAGIDWGLCDWSCMGVSVSADALYLRPMVDRQKTAVISVSLQNPIGFQSYTELSSDWGFEVAASLFWKCDKQVRFRWFRLESSNGAIEPVPPNDGNAAIDVNVGSPQPYFGSVSGFFISGSMSNRVDLSWNAFEIDFSSQLFYCPRYTVALSGALHYVNAHYSAVVRYQGVLHNLLANPSTLDYNGSAHSFALGPKGGVSLAAMLCWGWQLKGEAGVAALVGRSCGKFHQFTFGAISNTPFEISDQGTLQLFPHLNLRLGLEWTYAASDWCCWWFEVGFETVSYWGLLRQPDYYNGEGRALSLTETTALNLAGLYLGGGVRF